MHYYYFSSFILKYRAIWDKIMRCILLIMAEDEEYIKFDKAKAVKNPFKNLLKFLIFQKNFMKK